MTDPNDDYAAEHLQGERLEIYRKGVAQSTKLKKIVRENFRHKDDGVAGVFLFAAELSSEIAGHMSQFPDRSEGDEEVRKVAETAKEANMHLGAVTLAASIRLEKKRKREGNL